MYVAVLKRISKKYPKDWYTFCDTSLIKYETRDCVDYTILTEHQFFAHHFPKMKLSKERRKHLRELLYKKES